MQDFYPRLYFGINHAIVVIQLLCALVLWLQRNEGERSRRFLAWTWLICAAIFMIRIMLHYSHQSDYATIEILPVASLVGGLVCVAVLLIYPIETISPHWLNFKRLLLAFSPMLLLAGVVVAMLGCGIEFRKLFTFEELVLYWTEPNVWIRFLLSAVIIVYSFLIFYIPRNKMRSNTTFGWMRSYSIGLQGISVLYFGINLVGLYPTGIFHLTYFLLFSVYITYQELFLRLFLTPQEKLVSLKDRAAVPKNDLEVSKLISDRTSLLWIKLEAYMKSEEPWRDPNITLTIIADGVGSNRTTISALIQKAGYENFYDYIAQYRIEAFCLAATQGVLRNIQDAFFEVGFRNRNTALNQFKKQMGMTPSDYLQNRR